MAGKETGLTITILGSGTCVPSLRRSSCAVLVAAGTSRVLFDCGAGTMHRLLQAKSSVFEISHVFLSHFHPDHSGETASFLFARKYSPSPPQSSPLLLAGGTGFMEFFKKYRHLYGEWIEPGEHRLRLREFGAAGEDCYHGDDFIVITRPVNHRPESIAFRLERNGRSLVYSGDSDEDINLEHLAREADLFICEAALPDGFKVEGHLTPALAAKTAARAGAKKLVMTHLYPPCDEVDIRKQAAAFYSGPLVVAEDLMTFQL